jgi:aminoglycoside/choline kinase family phosphotransferase
MVAERPTDGSDARSRIDRFFEGRGITPGEVRVVALTGDASDRQYFRAQARGEPTQVLAVHPRAIVFDELPFANVMRLLAAMPVPAPRVLGHSDKLGIIALEDLGDVTLQAHLATATRDERHALYREAVALIHVLQRRGAELASPDYVPYGLAFDEDKLTSELRFFTTHFLEAHRGARPDAAARDALSAEYAAIAAELSAEPRMLCHRDYHSRNLMLHRGRLHIIDFQDARMGPDTYDLASLLRDSYVDFAEAQVDDLIASFLALRGGTDGGAAPPAPGEFRRRFDLMSLQRNLKALGTFGHQATSRGNAAFVQYIPRTLTLVRSNMARNPRFSRLRELLATHLDELR